MMPFQDDVEGHAWGLVLWGNAGDVHQRHRVYQRVSPAYALTLNLH